MSQDFTVSVELIRVRHEVAIIPKILNSVIVGVSVANIPETIVISVVLVCVCYGWTVVDAVLNAVSEEETKRKIIETFYIFMKNPKIE